MDRSIIHTMQKISEPFARATLAVLFCWFGILKVFELSPATPLVQQLFEKTIDGVPFGAFLVAFGVFEVMLGVLFLIPKAGRLAVLLLLLHMGITFLPLILLPETAWTGFLIPTMEGQYIIKNLALIGLAIGVVAHFHPMRQK